MNNQRQQKQAHLRCPITKQHANHTPILRKYFDLMQNLENLNFNNKGYILDIRKT